MAEGGPHTLAGPPEALVAPEGVGLGRTEAGPLRRYTLAVKIKIQRVGRVAAELAPGQEVQGVQAGPGQVDRELGGSFSRFHGRPYEGARRD